MPSFSEVMARPLRVELPWSERGVGLPVDRLRAPARGAATAVLVVMMGIGVALAVVAAVLAETDSFEAVGTLGTELGAALWFGGAVAWGARRNATAARGLLLMLTFVLGLLLIAAAVLLDWKGAALSLAMEFGVGLLAVPVIDVVLLGTLHGRLDAFGRGAGGASVRLCLGRGGHLVRIVRETPAGGPPLAADISDGPR